MEAAKSSFLIIWFQIGWFSNISERSKENLLILYMWRTAEQISASTLFAERNLKKRGAIISAAASKCSG
jgi:hypothetical protein